MKILHPSLFIASSTSSSRYGTHISRLGKTALLNHFQSFHLHKNDTHQLATCSMAPPFHTTQRFYSSNLNMMNMDAFFVQQPQGIQNEKSRDTKNTTLQMNFMQHFTALPFLETSSFFPSTFLHFFLRTRTMYPTLSPQPTRSPSPTFSSSPSSSSSSSSSLVPLSSVLSPSILFLKRTFQPSLLRKKRKHGFLARLGTVGGRKVLKRRFLKGRARVGGGL